MHDENGPSPRRQLHPQLQHSHRLRSIQHIRHLPPPTFIATTSKEDKSAKGKKNKGEADNISDKNESKKARSRVENTSQPEEFKLQAGEVWATQFAGKIAGRVIWEVTPASDYKIFMCTRWFIGGYCFSNCHNAKSHVAANQVPADKMTAFAAYMSGCRGETNTT